MFPSSLPCPPPCSADPKVIWSMTPTRGPVWSAVGRIKSLLVVISSECDFVICWCFTVCSSCFYTHTGLQDCPFQCVCQLSVCSFVSASVCPSVRLLAEPQGTLAVWCNVPRRKTLLAAPPERGCDGGGEETGAHFLWKWGYHFTNYWCNYCRGPEEAWERCL